MSRKILAALLALLLALGAASAALGAEALPGSFIPEQFVSAFNRSISRLAKEPLADLSDTEFEQVVNSLFTLAYTEEDGTVAYYNNGDWSLEVSAHYASGTIDLNTVADAVNLSVSVEAGEGLLYLARQATALTLVALDSQLSADAYQPLMDWLETAQETGERYRLNDYYLVLLRDDAHWQYALLSAEHVQDEAQAEATGAPDIFGMLNDYVGGNQGGPSPDSAGESGLTPLGTLSPTAGESAPAPIPDAAGESDAVPSADDGLLLSWNGFSVELLRIEPAVYSDGYVDLTFYCRFVNDTDYKIDMFVEDATVGGVPVDGVGQMDIQPHTEAVGEDAYFFLLPNSKDGDASLNAICNHPGQLVGTFRLMAHTDELYAQPFSIDLAGVPSFTPRPTESPTPAPDSSEYETLSPGDTGDGVAQLQLELIDLGYLAPPADGVYGSQTAEAVRLFNEANGLGSSEIATPETQNRLYSNDATPYEEPWVPLVAQNGARGEWTEQSGNLISARVQFTNVSRTQTIKSFEVHMYCTDASGENLYGEGTYYYDTTDRQLAPGETAYCDYITMPNCSEARVLYAGVKRVVFADGTVRENDAVDYADWAITWD